MHQEYVVDALGIVLILAAIVTVSTTRDTLFQQRLSLSGRVIRWIINGVGPFMAAVGVLLLIAESFMVK